MFEETESGELVAWETWKRIINDRQPDIYYCGNGTFIMNGGLGISVGHYTQEGTHEPLMDYYHTIGEFIDNYYMISIWLTLYKNGEVVKEMAYERCCDIETNEDIIEWESEEAREGEKIANEILAALGEGRKLSVDDTECCDETEMILLRELQSP